MTFLESEWEVTEDPKMTAGRIGGEIITPTSTLIDEKDGGAAVHRGYISALVEASNKVIPPKERSKNIQEIVISAREAGVSASDIANTLDELGVPYRHGSDTEPSPAPNRTPKEEKPDTSGIKGFDATPVHVLADSIPINEDDPPLPDSFRIPIGNMFDVEDEPTLSGKIVAQIYKQFTERSGKTLPDQAKSEELGRLSKASIREFQSLTEEEENRRKHNDLKPIRSSFNRIKDEPCFHMDGDNQLRHFMFYFNSPRQGWKYPQAPTDRAYITLDPSDAHRTHQLFVELVSRLHDADIDFNAKAACALAMATRTDNMVFYISVADQAKASGLIKEFLDEKGVGAGHVQAALPSPRDGLSWAHETNPTHTKIWQEVTGSTERTSFNALTSTLVLPAYLKRLVKAHEDKGNHQVANIYSQEARRVEDIINRYSSQTS